MSSRDPLEAYWNAMTDLISAESSRANFKIFSSISERFIAEYKEIQELGLPGQTVAFAMLCASVNMYALTGSQKVLPQVLRQLADLLDEDKITH